MAAALEDTNVRYEDLAEIEREFDEVETEIIRQQVTLSAPVYAKRAATVSKIPNFWPLVLEQAPPDIDQYIQPSDSALLLSSLVSLSVSHFELDVDPRSVSITFEFAENEHFENKVLEKKFWYRRHSDGWAGLVSEPVKITWKKEKDLTSGLLDLVIEAEKSIKGKKIEPKQELTKEQQTLAKKIEGTGMGGLSFFAWFGFVGRRISAEESAQATAAEKAKRNGNGKEKPASEEDEKEDEDDEEDWETALEIFPDGHELAISLSEDLWPGAIRYFTQAQEQDALSDADFESDDEDLNELLAPGSDDDDEPPAKKQKSK